MIKTDAVIYIHGKGGGAQEAEHYKPLFPLCDVFGVDYKGSAPWEAGREINKAITELKLKYDKIILIANSIGAYFSMNSDIENSIYHACFISPIVDLGNNQFCILSHEYYICLFNYN